MIDTKTRLLAVAGSLALLLLIVDLVRRRKLKEEYSVLWVGAAIGLLILASWVQLLSWITTAIGGVTLSSTIFFFALLFVFFVLLHYSVRISSMERRMTALVQEMGLAAVRTTTPSLGGGAPTEAEPRVAVIIPCHDDGALLREALASVEEEEPVEIVVVDDGSTDPGTRIVLDELAAAGTMVIRQENRGAAEARSAGLRATTAPLAAMSAMRRSYSFWARLTASPLRCTVWRRRSIWIAPSWTRPSVMLTAGEESGTRRRLARMRASNSRKLKGFTM